MSTFCSQAVHVIVSNTLAAYICVSLLMPAAFAVSHTLCLCLTPSPPPPTHTHNTLFYFSPHPPTHLPPIQDVNFDVVDATGDEQIAVEDLSKKRYPNPKARSREGCRVAGSLHVSKVAGNFHFALGKGVPGTAMGNSMSTDPFAKTMVGAQHQHRFEMHELALFNASHYINKLSFGENIPFFSAQPLEGTGQNVESGVGQYNYYVSVVPTRYTRADGKSALSFQYSYTQKFVEVASTARSFPHPGVFFFLSFSPLVVDVREESGSFLHFFTNLCAIAGATWVISGFVRSIVEKLGGYFHLTPATDEAETAPLHGGGLTGMLPK
jgi:Endoplasmic reticulum vesicle transporter